MMNSKPSFKVTFETPNGKSATRHIKAMWTLDEGTSLNELSPIESDSELKGLVAEFVANELSKDFVLGVIDELATKSVAEEIE